MTGERGSIEAGPLALIAADRRARSLDALLSGTSNGGWSGRAGQRSCHTAPGERLRGAATTNGNTWSLPRERRARKAVRTLKLSCVWRSLPTTSFTSPLRGSGTTADEWAGRDHLTQWKGRWPGRKHAEWACPLAWI